MQIITAPLTSAEPCGFLPAENLALWIGFTWCLGFVLAGVSFTWSELGRRGWVSEHHCLTHYSDYWTLGDYLVVFFLVGGGACPHPIPVSRHQTLKTFWLKNKGWLLFYFLTFLTYSYNPQICLLDSIVTQQLVASKILFFISLVCRRVSQPR